MVARNGGAGEPREVMDVASILDIRDQGREQTYCSCDDEMGEVCSLCANLHNKGLASEMGIKVEVTDGRAYIQVARRVGGGSPADILWGNIIRALGAAPAPGATDLARAWVSFSSPERAEAWLRSQAGRDLLSLVVRYARTSCWIYSICEAGIVRPL